MKRNTIIASVARILSQTTLAILLLVVLTAVSTPSFAADISGSGWRLWPDAAASWQNDTLYLPSEVNLRTLPVNPPTGGWSALNANAGMPVTLPSTVEEHYWGKFGFRPYTRDVAAIFSGDKTYQNGDYQGVSWWWRTIQAPVLKPGQRLILHIRGARLRTEVYCNGKLCGYTIMTELPFDSDLTDAVRPGQPAQVALRITSPGGILDWNDFVPEHFFAWGKYTFPMSHGFCGLDSGITLSARDDVNVSDLAALNTPDLHTIHLIAQVDSRTRVYRGPVALKIARAGKVIWSASPIVSIAPGTSKTVELDAHVPSALPWSNDHPNLYEATAQIGAGPIASSGRVTDFGFRFFTARGVETAPDPVLTFNGKRIVVRSAISWGFWGRNGLWPDEEMARREVTDAKAFGLNCLQFHRNIAKPMVLDLQDRLGLLRYEEPGSGAAALGDRYDIVKGATYGYKPGYDFPDNIDTSGKGPDGDAAEFWEKYEEEKILEMVKRDRSHPSLIMYCLQNEGSGHDMRNPRIYRIFREVHALDPSRIMVFCSGMSPKVGQVLMLPYSDKITYASSSDLYGGWRDRHTVGGPGNYTDSLYTDPTNYSHNAVNDANGAIVMYGEMLGVGTPDNFERLVNSFDAQHPSGYDLDDDRRALTATHDFLDKWGFRTAFPTDSDYYDAIGNKSYFFWQKIIEQARATNMNDYLVISGWESTTIDNHSGLVDNHRFFKGDPSILRRANLPEVLVVRPRKLVLAKGQTDTVDVYLINETGRSGPQTLTVSVKRPDGTVIGTTTKTVNATGGETYGELLTSGIDFNADTAGMLQVDATLAPHGATGASTLSQHEQVNVIDPAPALAAGRAAPKVAVLETDSDIADTLTSTLHITPVPFAQTIADPASPVDVIVLSSKGRVPDFDALAAGPAANPAPKGASKTLDAVLSRVKNDGTRLVLFGNGEAPSRWMIQELANRKIVTLSDWVGHTGASWFGTWYFVRSHWLFDGLPTNCAMDWRYDNSWQPEHESNRAFDGTGGAVVSAPGMEAACGYASNNTKTLIGISACVVPYGKGQIVWYCLPQLTMALSRGALATNTAVAQRLLANAVLHPLDNH